MKIFLAVLMCFYGLVSCDDDNANRRSPGPPSVSPIPTPNQNPKPNPEPLPGDEPGDEILESYEPNFTPLKAEMFRLRKSNVPYADDFFLYQQGLSRAWEESRVSNYIPSKWLSLWNPDSVKYVDDTDGEVKGIEKLEVVREQMLSKFPILSRPEYNTPIEVVWASSEERITGRYKATQIFLTESVDYFSEQRYFTIFNGSLFTNLSQKIWIYGKNDLWDYPFQTVDERAGSLGIDETFIHEWGHHLAYAIDVNLGRSSYQTWQFTESWAETFRYVVFGSHLDKPEILESDYRFLLSAIGGNHTTLRNPSREPAKNHSYALRSMEKCIVHEKHHGKFDPSTFLVSLIQAYKRVEGRKLDPNPYPIRYIDSGYAQAPWVGGAFRDNRRLTSKQPLLVTRAEFLERFLEVYDCGLANEFIEADIEGMKKFEW